MKVLFVSPEGAPFAKTGGLGDVAEALPRALKDRQIEVKVILPYYRSIEKTHGHQMKEVARFVVSLGWRKRECRVHYLAMEEMDYWFVQGEDYFDRDNLYGYGDDGERFAFFSLAVLEFLGHGDYSPDIIHLSDWQTALVPVLLKIRYGQKGGYSHIKTVFTIHNIHYQGICHLSFLKDVLDMEEDGKFLLLHEDQVNLMKGGILACDALTTVSPTYAEEIQTREFGMGLQEVIGKE
ncbi:MAG: glycogen synthase, partial [Bacteroidia bacterium]|nr:glycogen synthase [Bacteroidia bacterium]